MFVIFAYHYEFEIIAIPVYKNRDVVRVTFYVHPILFVSRG